MLPNKVKIEFFPRHDRSQRTPGKVGLSNFLLESSLELGDRELRKKLRKSVKDLTG
jgi:hypothetical protein